MGTEMEGKNVCFNLDNQAVVDVLKAKYSRDSMLAYLLRCLCLFCCQTHILVLGKACSGTVNGAADALSRNKIIRFFKSFPQEMQKVSTL